MDGPQFRVFGSQGDCILGSILGGCNFQVKLLLLGSLASIILL